ncbi:NADP-dependent 3-hydroxy acid dehydrogenase YdfG [Actinopolymorpha cephalotaxi]|uniref:NAD(P)-dependent dehydrogenase (Short-subunit alcohol dehydrogenase family) n=1 Tax=Actinopolymorpha cephalotaxi TaxID=504797 RepID=A0A1I2Q1G9_9ACTN|nr:SDR family oxidoreductase [Actinopolymorpha cephalotaxi]NYH83413.1 NAD(P)-dependent dehydrogenase (short-subunit alcohol dehydrogenase family) [Actinopolymorpha cephalotaxi]SFG21523.1 NADP-dependent 3-hydroxy acid dehydrogenase YdfG [Actinopolymorpha cephalotaxi]
MTDEAVGTPSTPSTHGAPVAVVTGAGSGVGRAVAVALAAEGHVVVLAGRRPEPLAEAAAECARAWRDAGRSPGTAGSAGEPVLAVPTDVADPDSVAALFGAVRTEYGRLDVLVNNAGRNAPAASVEDLSLADWRAVVDVNLTGAFLCTQHAVRLMKEQRPRGGRIINNGSLSAHTPRPHSAAYTATKHAISGLTRATALDGRPYDIACGQIDIGNAATDMTARMAEGVAQPDGSVRPEPTIDVAHVARAVVYMAGLPLDANVPAMTVMATRMPYVGRG